jgi:hypothetical protein
MSEIESKNNGSTDRVRISFEELVELSNAARLASKRVLPDGKAVAQFSRLIQWAKPYVRIFSLRSDNIRRAHAPDADTVAQEGSKITIRDPIGQNLELAELGREIVHEDDDQKNGLPKPPLITQAMMPKKLEGDRKTDNHEGVAEMQADLGVAFAWPAEPSSE